MYHVRLCKISHFCFCFLFKRTNKFCKELKKLIPNTELLYRRGLDLKKIIPQALSKNFTDLIVINEDRGIPSILCLQKITNLKLFTLLNWYTTCLGLKEFFPWETHYWFSNDVKVVIDLFHSCYEKCLKWKGMFCRWINILI